MYLLDISGNSTSGIVASVLLQRYMGHPQFLQLLGCHSVWPPGYHAGGLLAKKARCHRIASIIIGYSGTSEERTIWDQAPLFTIQRLFAFRGCHFCHATAPNFNSFLWLNNSFF